MPYTYRHANEEFRAYIADAKERLETPSDKIAHAATDGVFQTLRRRLVPQDALHFADVLPSVLRAIFLWRWQLADPVPFASREAHAAEALSLRAHHNFAPPTLIGDVAWALRRHVDTMDCMDCARILDRLGPEAQAYWSAEDCPARAFRPKTSFSTPKIGLSRRTLARTRPRERAMFLSVFDIFKVGIGPSSSHTMGPMVAAARFLDMLRESPFHPRGLKASLHGSLAFTGAGHATDRATILGLAGFDPESYDAAKAEAALAAIRTERTVTPPGLPTLAFDPSTDLTFDYGPALPGHANGMILGATDAQGDTILQETFYSIGGGFVLTEAEQEAAKALTADPRKSTARSPVPFPFQTAAEMLEMAAKSDLTVAQMKRANERKFRTDAAIDTGLARLWEVMEACMNRGLTTSGTLPGGLSVRRRAASIRAALEAERGLNLTAPHTINDWMSCYAMAVNEENAAGGQVVTAPTNGAAGVVPAVIRYWLDHVPGANRTNVGDFLLTAAAIGGLAKHNASISGAECGCQAEVGSASAMAAAGLAAVMGATPEQVENAAEIALEHHLGMTCDPVKGLVQVPCIERNGLGAIKAVSAASLALRGDGKHLVSLDACIETMRQTGQDMHERYKETSLGGLAVNVPNC